MLPIWRCKALEALVNRAFIEIAELFPLAPCKSILNTFVYEIYQRVSILFELSIKHTLSDFFVAISLPQKLFKFYFIKIYISNNKLTFINNSVY